MECRISELTQIHLPLNAYDCPASRPAFFFSEWGLTGLLSLDWLFRVNLALSGADFIKMQEKLREADLCGLGTLNP